MPSSNLHHRKSAGFTLVEMAVVVVLMGIVLTMGLRMLTAAQENAARSQTQKRQELIKTALIAFLRTNGRLPCPDSALPPTGVEPAACLTTAGFGVVPWQTLGLGVSDVQDGWSQFISYRVANRTPVASSNWTTKLGAPAAAPFTITELTAPLGGLTLQARNDAGVLQPAVVPSPVVVLVSHGKNGAGARTLRGTAVLPLPTGADELSNAQATSTVFITRTHTDVAPATGGTFDDLVTTMSPKDLLQPLLDDKTLKGVASAYFELALAQLAVFSCTPPSAVVAQPLLNAISPTVGNGAVTYSCLAGDLCNSATAVHSGPPITPGAQVLYRLQLFGAAAQPVSYAQLQAAYPAIQTRCP